MWRFMTLFWGIGTLGLLFLLISDQETPPLPYRLPSSKGNFMSLEYTLALFRLLTCVLGFGVRFTPLDLMGLCSPSWLLVGRCLCLLGCAIFPPDLLPLCCGRLMRGPWGSARLLWCHMICSVACLMVMRMINLQAWSVLGWGILYMFTMRITIGCTLLVCVRLMGRVGGVCGGKCPRCRHWWTGFTKLLAFVQLFHCIVFCVNVMALVFNTRYLCFLTIPIFGSWFLSEHLI